MLNLVPIQFLALFGYAILRVTVGLVWCHLALRHYQARTTIIPTLSIRIFPFPKIAWFFIVVTELLIGILFTIGFLTQVAAVLAVVWCLKLLILRQLFSHPSFPDRLSTLLLLTIAITLFITGAGVPAFDLPV